MAGPNRQYYDTLGSLTGQVRAVKPTIPPTLVQTFANNRIRQVLDRQAYWSGLLGETILYIPPTVTGGSVTLTQNSNIVTGSGTTWPVADSVNTTIPLGIIRQGYQEVTPASMAGITVDSYLYVDSGGSPEVVSVSEVRPTSFLATFGYTHSANCTVTSSSLCGRQLRLGNTYPILTITAVQSATSLLTDLRWMATTLPGAAYTIWQMYYTISPDIKALLAIVDQAQGLPPLKVNVPVLEINRIDPQRSATGYPQMVANHGTNQNDNVQWEIWPRATEERQLRVMYYRQPPKLISEGDRLPAFMNPSVLLNGCIADALKTKVGERDAFYDPKGAMAYEASFQSGLDMMILQDSERVQSQYESYGTNSFFGGANFWQSHDFDVLTWGVWG